MAVILQPCPACARHINVEEAACPFCRAATPQGFANVSRPRMSAPLSRAAILFASATAITGVAACSSSSSPTPVADSGPSPSKDSGEDTSIVAAYGPAPVDSGKLDSTVEMDSGGPVAAYGPAVFDSGNFEQDSGGALPAYGPAPIDGGAG